MLIIQFNRFTRSSIFTLRHSIPLLHLHSLHHHVQRFLAFSTMPPRSKHHNRHHPPSSSSPPTTTTAETIDPSSPFYDPTAIHLDGKTLEGGGQILRLSLCLASLTHRNVLITDIRGNRPRNGGLKSQHLTGVQSLARACKAEVVGGHVGSRTLLFKPGAGVSHNLVPPPPPPPPPTSAAEGEGEGVGSVSGDYTTAWQHNNTISITQPTPGSIGLIIQAVLPYILFSPPSSSPSSSSSTIIKLNITGGTHVPFSPSYEYIKHVFLPTLSTHLNLPTISINLLKQGWTHGRLTVGEVELSIPTITHGTKLPSFRLENRGDVIGVELYTRIPLAAGNKALTYAVNTHLYPAFPEGIPITVHDVADSEHDKRFYMLLVAHTSNGYRIGYDYLYQHKVKTLEKVVEFTVEMVVRGLKRELDRGGCVDEYAQDQLVVFQTLCWGVSFVDGGGKWEGSLHTRTARWVAEEMFGVKWDGRGGCDGGIGFVAGVGVEQNDSNDGESTSREGYKKKSEVKEEEEERLKELEIAFEELEILK